MKSRMEKLTATGAAMLSLLTLAACQRPLDAPRAAQIAPLATRPPLLPNRAPQAGPGPLPDWLHGTGPDAAPNKVEDAALAATVSAALARDPTLNTSQVDVDNANGHVILSGVAPDATARVRAGALARDVDGVMSVQNELYVPLLR